MKIVKKLLIILRIIADCRSPAVLSTYHFFRDNYSFVKHPARVPSVRTENTGFAKKTQNLMFCILPSTTDRIKLPQVTNYN
jgi:hypothetical protein